MVKIRIPSKGHKESALTLVEVLVILALIAILAAMFLPSASYSGPATGERCADNLKQIGEAMQSWANDHQDDYPMEISIMNGGTKEYMTGSDTFEHFIVLSNYLKGGSPTLVCPIDRRGGIPYPPKDFSTLSNVNVSYFVNLKANHSYKNFFLSGDFFPTSNIPVLNGILSATKQTIIGWTNKHSRSRRKFYGNILFSDGHVDSLPNPKGSFLV